MRQKAAAHANTPDHAHLDTLGRTFLTIADNGAEGKYATRVELDIEGNQRAVIDALDRKVMVYDYDMLGNRIHQASMEAGERWMLNDATGKPIRAWDSRGHEFRTSTTRCADRWPSCKAPIRKIRREIPSSRRTEYGEGQPNDRALNLRTRGSTPVDRSG